ncbi:MAG: AI-2E family transporter [Desulfobacterales bacterium]|nr:AI-2E family transporter [Desulfobacterales bacterium]
MDRNFVGKMVLLLVVFFISVLFFSMIRTFLMAIFLAGLFSALAHPLYLRFEKRLRGRRSLASLATLLLIVCFVVLPLIGLMGIVTAQALRVGNSVKPWVQQQIAQPDAFFATFKSLPYFDQIAPYRDMALQKAGEMVGGVSGFLINSLSSATIGTVNFIFTTMVMLYAMYFFLMDGEKLIQKILYYLPLEDKDEQRMLERFTSVARATLKGTAVIGILQGGVAGVAFAVVGIPSAVFWGVIMAVLSIIPGIGTALVWLPAAILLGAAGHVAAAVGLAVFCAVVVGGLDNLLRPILVGKDTQMHELLIFFGTMGGILMFGMIGFVIGPIIAALFVTVWDIYGVAFQDFLPATGPPMDSSPPGAENQGGKTETGDGADDPKGFADGPEEESG